MIADSKIFQLYTPMSAFCHLTCLLSPVIMEVLVFALAAVTPTLVSSHVHWVGAGPKWSTVHRWMHQRHSGLLKMSFVHFCTNCWHAALWFLALTHFPSRWVMSFDETSLFFAPFFTFNTNAAYSTCTNSLFMSVCVCVCIHGCANVFVCVHARMFGTWLLLIAHRIATWTVYW